MIRTKSAQGYSSSSPDAEQLFSALDCTASASWCIKPAPRRTPAAAWKAARVCEIERCMADKRNQHPRQSVYMFKGLERAEDVRTAVYIAESADKYRLKRCDCSISYYINRVHLSIVHLAMQGHVGLTCRAGYSANTRRCYVPRKNSGIELGLSLIIIILMNVFSPTHHVSQ